MISEENEALAKIAQQDIEAGVIDEDQITEWVIASPQDISWLPDE